MAFPTARVQRRQLSIRHALPIMPRQPPSFERIPSMAAREKTKQARRPAAVLLAADAKQKSIPIWLARDAGWLREAPLSERAEGLGGGAGLQGQRAASTCCCRAPTARIAGVVLGLGEARAGDPMDKPELAVGPLPAVLPPGCYHLADDARASRSSRPSPGASAPIASAATSRGDGAGGGRSSRCRAAPTRPRARHRRGGLARPRPHQHAGQRHGAAGAGGCRPPARQDARRRRVEHRRRRSAGQELSR